MVGKIKIFFYFLLFFKNFFCELINVLHFNEKKIDFLNNTKQ